MSRREQESTGGTVTRGPFPGLGSADPPGARAFADDVVVIDGCGPAGLPLGIALAGRGLRVAAYDVDEESVAAVNAALLPPGEDGARSLLAEVVAAGRLHATIGPATVAHAEHVVVVLDAPEEECPGTDPFPDPRPVPPALQAAVEHVVDGQVLIVCGCLYPGATAMVERLVAGLGREVDLAFCPRRTAAGATTTELDDQPQIVAARTARARERAAALLRNVTPRIVLVDGADRVDSAGGGQQDRLPAPR